MLPRLDLWVILGNQSRYLEAEVEPAQVILLRLWLWP